MVASPQNRIRVGQNRLAGSLTLLATERMHRIHHGTFRRLAEPRQQHHLHVVAHNTLYANCHHRTIVEGPIGTITPRQMT